MKPTPILKIFIAIVISFIIIVFGVYYFLISEIKDKNENISKLRNDIAVQQEKQINVASMQTMLQNNAVDILRVNNYIISKEGDVAFIKEVESVGRKYGLEIEINNLSFKNNEKLSSQGLIFLNVKLSATGKWASIYSFVYELESLPYGIKVNTSSLTASENPVNDINGKEISISTEWRGYFDIDVLKYK